jgi:hypothetical protein
VVEEIHVSTQKINLAEIDKQLGVGADYALLQVIALDDMAVNLRHIRKDVERDFFLGYTFSPLLDVNDAVQTLDLINNKPYYTRPAYLPLITAYFFNNGPDPVYVLINQKSDPFPLKKNQSNFADYAKADRRIELINFWCDTGLSASLQLIGKY